MTMLDGNFILEKCVSKNRKWYYDPSKMTEEEMKEYIQQYKEDEKAALEGEPVIRGWDYIKIDLLEEYLKNKK